MIIYKTVQKVISQDSQQKMQFLEYKTTLKSDLFRDLFREIWLSERVLVLEKVLFACF